jgi:hypothetical protein
MTDATFKTRAAAFWAELKQLETKYGVELVNNPDDSDDIGPILEDAFLKSKGVEP